MSMKNMFLLIVLTVSLPASAQLVAVNGFCENGAQSAVVSGMNSTNKLQGITPGCLVTPYLTGTTTLATYYMTPTGSPQTGPFTADTTTGQYLFYAYIGVALDVVRSSGTTQTGLITEMISGCASAGNLGYLLADNGSGGCADAHLSDGEGLSWTVGYPSTTRNFTVDVNGYTAFAGSGTVYFENNTSGYATPVSISSTSGHCNTDVTSPLFTGGSSDFNGYVVNQCSLQSNGTAQFSGIAINGSDVNSPALAVSGKIVTNSDIILQGNANAANYNAHYGYSYSPSLTLGSPAPIVGSLVCLSGGNEILCPVGTTVWNGVFQGSILDVGGRTEQVAQVVGGTYCTFDNTAVVGDYVIPSSSVAGDCHDNGASVGYLLVGRVLNAATVTPNVLPPLIELAPTMSGQIGASGTVNSGTIGQLAYYAANGTAVSGTAALPTGTTATTPALGFATPTAIGDSLTQGSDGTPYPTQLSTSLGLTVTNLGSCDQTSTQIAERIGAESVTVTLTGNSIPTSGSVIITASQPVGVTSGCGGPSVAGTIAGVPGIISYSSPNVLFTPTVYPGTAQTVSNPVLFTPTVTATEFNGLNIIWVGRYNYPSLSTIMADIAAIVAYLPTPKNYLIMSILNSDNYGVEYIGQTGYNEIAADNAAIAAAYPNNYLDIWSILVAAYNPASAQDVIDNSHGVVPSSLRGVGAYGTLTAAVTTTGQTSIGIAACPGGYGGGTIVVGTELMEITACTSNTATVLRGYAGTSAATYLINTAYTITDTIHLNTTGYGLVSSSVDTWMRANINTIPNVNGIYDMLSTYQAQNSTAGMITMGSVKSGTLATDLNTQTSWPWIGYATTAATANIPTTGSGTYYVTVLSIATSANYLTQIAVDTNGLLFTRLKTATWGSWNQIGASGTAGQLAYFASTGTTLSSVTTLPVQSIANLGAQTVIPTVLTGSSQVFSWNAVSGAAGYKLTLGTTPGTSDIYNSYTTTATTKTATGIPTNGSTIYATLYTEIGTTWTANAFTYTASGTAASPTTAFLISPAVRSAAPTDSPTFTGNVQAPSINGTAVYPYNSMTCYGDSVTAGTGADNFKNAFCGLMGIAIGVAAVNDGHGGKQTADLIPQIYTTASTNPKTQLQVNALGINDTAFFHYSANVIANYKLTRAEQVAYEAIPASVMKTAQSGSCSYSGTWTNSSWAALGVTASAIGKQTTASGATATCTVTSPTASTVVDVSTMMVDSNAATGTVTVDGGSPVALPFTGTNGQTITTSNPTTFASALTRVTGLTASTTHTVVIACTNSSGTCYFNWTAAVSPSMPGPTVLYNAVIPEMNNTNLNLNTVAVASGTSTTGCYVTGDVATLVGTGSSGTVVLTASSCTVTGLTIKYDGTGYPASGTYATTGGSGTGLTVSFTGVNNAANFDTADAAVVAMLQGDGLTNIIECNATSVLNSQNYYYDALHPNLQGHYLYAEACLSALSTYIGATLPQLPAWIGSPIYNNAVNGATKTPVLGSTLTTSTTVYGTPIFPALTTAGVMVNTSGGSVSSNALQGTDTSVMTAGTVSGTGATLCTDALGGATTSGCAGAGTGTVNSGTIGQLAYYAASGTAVSGTAALPTGTTATTPAPYTADGTVETALGVQTLLALDSSSVELTGITGGTYNLGSPNNTLAISWVASGGTITSVTVVSGGTGAYTGDIFTALGGSLNSYLVVTGVSAPGGAVTTMAVVGSNGGGTGYTTGSGGAIPVMKFPNFINVSGTLTSNVVLLLAPGSLQTTSTQFLAANNCVVGAYSVQVKMGNGSGGSTGTGITLAAGTNNSTAEWVYSDGVNDVWTPATGSGGGGSGMSGMTTGQIPVAATASTVTSSMALQGTDSAILTSGTISGTAATLCTDAQGGATTSGCTAGSGMTWPSTAGIAYWTSGTAWGGAYNAATPIPANYLPTALSSSTSVNGTTIPSSATLPTLGANNSWTGTETISTNGAASTSVISMTGSVYTGGTGTTTFPMFLIQPTGAVASTGWNTTGTMLGMIEPASGTANFLEGFASGGSSSLWYVNSAGKIGTAGIYPSSGSNAAIVPASTGTSISTSSNTNVDVTLGNTGTTPSGDLLDFEGGSNAILVGKVDISGGVAATSVTVPELTVTPITTPTNSGFTSASGAGTLSTSTTYYYRVAAVDVAGTTLASTETSVTTGGTAGNLYSVTVNWAAVANATSYKVYGRTTGAEQLMATVAALTWIDTGSVTPSGALPTANTTGNATFSKLSPASARKGTFICTAAGTITISNTNELATSDVTISLNTVGGTISTKPAMNGVTSGTGFTVLCGAADTSTYNYTIWN